MIERMQDILYNSRGDIGWKLETYADIATVHIGYLQTYSKLLQKFEGNRPNILEIGVLDGGSLLFWKELLQPNILCGMDIDFKLQPCIQEELYKGGGTDLKFILQDGYKDTLTRKLKETFPEGIDIAIDDGSHYLGDQINFIQFCLPVMRAGGVMIIEDLIPQRSQGGYVDSHYNDQYNSQLYYSRGGADPVKVLTTYLESATPALISDYGIHDTSEIMNRADDVIVSIHMGPNTSGSHIYFKDHGCAGQN